MIGRFLLVGGGNIVRQGITLVSQLLLARSLGEAGFGELTLAFSWFVVLAAAGDLGTRLYSWRRVAVSEEARRDEMLVGLIGARLLLALVVAAVLNVAIAALTHGRLATLLHLYTLGVVVNQSTFDWVFLSRGLHLKTFAFTVVSGFLYLGGIVALVGSSDQVALVPILFVASYGVPGVVLLLSSLDRSVLNDRALGIGWRETAAMVASNWRLFVYDLMQRGQSVAIILVASLFYVSADLAQFRIPHLMYGFVAACGIYLASTVFSDVARAVASGIRPAAVPRGILLLTCVLVPLGLVGHEMLSRPLSWFLQGTYPEFVSALQVLMPFLFVTALANFSREVAVSAGDTGRAVGSYVVSILAVFVALISYHPQDLAYLAWVLVGAELAGLTVVMRLRSFLTAGLVRAFLASIVVGVFLRQFWVMLDKVGGHGVAGYVAATGAIVALLAWFTSAAVGRWGAAGVNAD